MHHRGKTAHSGPKANGFVIGRVNIKAHGFERMHIGIYERGIESPKFVIQTTPDVGDQFSAKLERRDDNGDYSLEYFFQNFSDQDCKVTVLAKA